MGLSSLPAPSEGVLTLLLVNTALVISIFKEIVHSILQLFGLRLSPPSDPGSDHLADPYALSSAPESSLTDRFRSRFKPIRFGSAFGRRRPAERHADCRVCLARFESESVVNRLPCGHLFHKACLEKWLDYHHVTCPLCRTHLLPGEDYPSSSTSWPWF